MIDHPDWCELDPNNWVVFDAASEPEVSREASAVRDQGPFVAVVRGWRMRTAADLHHEVAAALQFPAYYGNNWNALDDCLQDLSWLGGHGLVLVITRAGEVLLDDDLDAEVLWESLVYVREAWRHPVEQHFGRAEPAPWTVVLQDDQDVLDRLVAASPTLSRVPLR